MELLHCNSQALVAETDVFALSEDDVPAIVQTHHAC